MFSKFKNLYMLYSGVPNSAKFRGGLQRASQDSTKGGVAIIVYFLRVKNITF